MINMPYHEIVEKIKSSTNLPESDIDAKVKQKIEQLSNLVSKEGAAYIVANELGIKLIDASSSKTLKISNISEGLRNINIVGKIIRLFDLKEFQVSARSGKLRSFTIADDSGNIRAVFWNDKADLLNDAKLNDVVDIKGVAVRKNNGYLELHSNETTTIRLNPNDVTVNVKDKSTLTYQRYLIKDLADEMVGNYVKITGVVVNMFDLVSFNLCPICRHKVYEKEGGFYCEEHNLVMPMESYVCSILVDDGTDILRVALWKNQIDKIGKDQIQTLMGKQVTVGGKLNRNNQTDKLEISASFIADADATEELAFVEGLVR